MNPAFTWINTVSTYISAGPLGLKWPPRQLGIKGIRWKIMYVLYTRDWVDTWSADPGSHEFTDRNIY